MSVITGIVTKTGREKMAKARAGEITLPKIMYMAFGDGACDETGNVIPPAMDQVTLSNELMRKEIESHNFPISTTCRYKARLSEGELSNIGINEVALIDSEGDVVGIKCFKNKYKDEDMEMVFEIDDEF